LRRHNGRTGRGAADGWRRACTRTGRNCGRLHGSGIRWPIWCGIFTDNGRDALATGKAPAWVKNELTLRALHEKHADTDYKKGRKRGA
jgi:hypothetical protein